MKTTRPFFPSRGETRRGFIKKTAVTAAAVASAPLFGSSVFAQGSSGGIVIVLDGDSPFTEAIPVRWAVEQLVNAFKERKIEPRMMEKLEQVPAGQEHVWVTAGHDYPPETIAFAHGGSGNRLTVSGSDVRGLVYALLEVADVVRYSDNPLNVRLLISPHIEHPANKIRSIARCFVSDVEDKGWYNDRDFWREYLTMLATQRFNRFSLTFGIGYDFTSDIRDCYFHFAYPFLLDVPGYKVRAVPLPDSERDSNLEMLKFIGEETARRGLEFQIGLWTHAYKWTNSPRANYTIEGLTPETQGPYSRDALTALLVAVPQIQGVTLRIHGESGVAEGSYDFWKMVFDGVVKCGRRVGIDMHAKGMDQPTLDGALATGLPVSIAPKYWAEHCGLPYMQASIRSLEQPKPNARNNGFFSQSSGSRSFLRYGYGDLLAEDRKYDVLHRVWPGTQRLLLWGDPALMAAHSRAVSFCDSAGVEFQEPLSFKGRKGSGVPGGRDGYADESLRSPGGGWEKFQYTYRLLGRMLYNPEAEPDSWRRMLHNQFGAGAESVEAALGHASWILPVITTAHLPSAANNSYWPEMYTNMSIPDEHKPHPYGDTLSPKRFGAVSPLDPQLFSRMDDFAKELLSGEASGKYSPAEVARWLDDHANAAEQHLSEARKKASMPKSPEFRRLALDVEVQSGIGHFFAHKFRAGVCWALFEDSGHKPALEQSIKSYRAARDAWAGFCEKVKGVYATNITFGYEKQLCGWWPDRLPAIDEDIADLEKRLAALSSQPPSTERKFDSKTVDAAIKAVLEPAARREEMVTHLPEKTFRRGEKITVEATAHSLQKLARLHYRRVNQAEQWRSVEMDVKGAQCTGTIPAEYTDSPYPIQYYFEFRPDEKNVWLHPGLHLLEFKQPYYVVRQVRA